MVNLEKKNFFDEYWVALGVKWNVQVRYDDNVIAPLVTSTKSKRLHELTMPTYYGENPRHYHSEYAHQLALAKLAEEYGESFSSPRFLREYDTEDPKFRSQARMFQVAWQGVVDTWASDLTVKVAYSFPTQDVNELYDLLVQTPGDFYEQEKGEVVRALALGRTFIDRYGLPSLKRKYEAVGRKAGAFLDPSVQIIGDALGSFYSQLPNLPKEKGEANILLVKSIQRACDIAGFPIRPSLTPSENRMVWRIDEVKR